VVAAEEVEMGEEEEGVEVVKHPRSVTVELVQS